MIVEHAVLPVIPGQEEAFEADFARARPLISAMPGFVDLTIARQVENPSQYLLLVQWESLEDHTVGFRGSPEYQEWRALLHHHYEPFPDVDHYTPLG
ncbi:antibiotic biosynthesis monooxygenase family protein [Leifsonia poae]|uniref:antibiotic biosynthesis monooxygenase family protein n=1 Tax=Leifsonia poae TaxID=110933 RepID=UPI003D67412E